MEAMIGAIVAIIAVLGLAYSFGVGRGSIDRFEFARIAEAVAQARMELLSTLPPNDPGFTTGSPVPFVVDGRTVGEERWVTDSAPVGTPGAAALQRVIVTVTWTWASQSDSVRYERLFPR